MTEAAIDPTDLSTTSGAAGQGQGVVVFGACVADCIWCGDHNRLLAVTSAGVISRCLRCGDPCLERRWTKVISREKFKERTPGRKRRKSFRGSSYSWNDRESR